MDIVERFEERAALAPGDIALVAGEHRIAYGDLDERANRLARLLQARGVGPETVVGLVMHRRPEYYAAMLAVLKAGAAFLPMDPGHPVARQAEMLVTARAALLLTEEALQEAFRDLALPVLTCEELTSLAAALSASRPARRLVSGQLRCVIFTSGSTGRPKGIGMPSQTIAKVADWAVDRLPGPQTFLQFTSLGFDVSLQEIFGALLSGGTLVLVTEEHRQDPATLLSLMARERVERVHLSPAYLRQLAAAALHDPARIRALALREIVVAGEPLRLTPEIREFSGLLEAAVLENQYGPSETHQATACTLLGGLARWPDDPPLGRPLPGVRGHVLDESLHSVPDGVQGELYLAGAGVTRGYLGRPDLTAERFLPDPDGPAGSRMYRTGDLVRRSAGGVLEFIGRADGQVKIRGHRVEPSEVDAVFAGNPAVREVVTVAHQSAEGTWALTAYLVPVPGAARPDTSDLRAHAEQRLPGYMVPAHLVTLDALPLNKNGKVDRGALPRPGAGRPDPSVPYAPPENPQQEILCGIWAETLDAQRVGIDDDFLALGGDSLRAMQIVSRTCRAFGVELSVRTLFQSPTVRGLAVAVKDAIIAELSAPQGADPST